MLTERRNTLLITGAGGSIGCHTLKHALNNTNWNIVSLDSFRHRGMTDRIEVMLQAHPEFRRRVRVYAHDLTSPISGLLASKIGEVDHIINMASLSDVHDSILHPVGFIQNNVNVILAMLEYARAVKPRTFLQISSDEVYGPTDGKSFHKEWDPIVPSNPYSASKAAQEAISIAYWRTYNVPLMIVNLMNNFGEMQSPAQRAMLPTLEALVAALEGYVDHVVDRAGRRLIGSYESLAEALRRRRVDRAEGERLVERLFGLELGQAQYDRGAAFASGVVERAGEEALARLWESARALPTPAEVDAPGLWLARIDLPDDGP